MECGRARTVRAQALLGLSIAALALLAGRAPLAAQGRTDYLNPESPQGHPLEVVRLAGHDYLVACNTRDNSIEVWDTDETVAERRLARVRVGLEPVSVRFNARLSQLFTANFLGDSVSVVSLAAPAGPASLSARLLHTTWVGDEPIDLAFYNRAEPTGNRETFFVTHMSPDGFGWRDAISFAPVAPGLDLVAAKVSLGFDTSNPPDGTIDDFIELAAKEPRTVLVRGDQLLILPLKGGSNPFATLGGDFDLYCDDLTAPFAQPVHLGGLHTTGLNMSFDGAGRLYIVGGEALDLELEDEPNVAAAPTGFVKSMFYLVEDPCSPSPTVKRRDVNLEVAALQPLALPPGAVQPLVQPVPKAKALSMLTDVVAFSGGAAVPKVFFTAFGNDRVGVIEPDPGEANPNLWPIRRIAVSPVNGNPLAGPNGLAIKGPNPGQLNDPGARLYVLNHLDSSITAVDPVAETKVTGGELSLFNDPRPAYLTQGQQFLYNAKLSGSGFVSCSSCHVAGRTDRRAWDLGTPGQPDVQIPTILPDGTNDVVFPADKGRLVTQSLQGLLNFEVPPGQQIWATNAPYHWRGDRASFLDFNPAFASLLGGQQLSPGEMGQFQEFINSIHYPPNPRERRNRQPSGVFGSGQNLSTDGSTDGFRGLKLFHLKASVGPRSCVTCHALPEGSNNRITDAADVVGQPIESAALRGLFQKEARRDLDGSSDPSQSPYTGLEGLFHTGFVPGSTLDLLNLTGSINAFNLFAFNGPLCGGAGFCEDLKDVSQLVHEFDWGVGPLVGCPATVDLTNKAQALPGVPSSGCDGACTDLASSLACMEQQAGLANSGIAVQASLAGSDRGFWYDPVVRLYREEPAGGGSLSRGALVGLVATDQDRLVFQAAPLGSERRIAAPNGDSSGPLAGPAPAGLRLLPMATDTFYRRVPELTLGWANLDNAALGSIFVHTVRLYQWGLILEAAGEGGFGLGSALRHDAPRRFQVAGDNIRHGAQLVLAYHNDASAGPPNPSLPVDQLEVGLLTLPLYPTSRLDGPSQRPVWQTAVELEPLAYYALMLGGPWAPGVAAAYLDQTPFTFPMVDPVLDQPAPGQFNPLAWNWLYVFILNADGSLGDGGWQRLRIE
jgi:hypothetical protein